MTPYKYFVLTTTLAFTLFSTNSLFAQGWEIVYDPQLSEVQPLATLQHPDGHIFLLGNRNYSPDHDSVFIKKITPEGFTEWIVNFPEYHSYWSAYSHRYILELDNRQTIFQVKDNNNLTLIGLEENGGLDKLKLNFLEIDAEDGQLIEALSPDLPAANYFPNCIRSDQNNNILVAGQIEGEVDDYFISSYGLDGNLNWTNTYDLIPDTNYLNIGFDPFFEQTPTGNFLLIQRTLNLVDSTGFMQSIEVASDGTLEHSTIFANFTLTPDESWDSALSLDVFSDNSYIISWSKLSTPDDERLLTKFSNSGTILWNKVFGETTNPTNDTIPFYHYNFTNGVLPKPDNSMSYVTVSDSLFQVIELDPNGNVSNITDHPYPYSNDHINRNFLIQTADGGTAWFGFPSPLTHGLITYKFASDGSLEWTSESIQRVFWTFHSIDIIQTTDGGFLYSGGISFIFGGIGLIKIDSSGVTFPNRVKGQVFLDLNENCELDSNEVTVANRIVEVNSANFDPTYRVTDENGYYEIGIPEGPFTVTVSDTGPAWDFCFGNPVIDSVGTGPDTVLIDFPMTPFIECPELSVNLHTPRIRNCSSSGKYFVEYCNNGTIEATDAYIEITFDDALIIDSATIAWSSQVGNTFTFPLDTIGLWECELFKVYYTSPCDVDLIGQTLCSEAHIFPDTLCGATSGPYLGAFMEASAQCQDSLIYFYLENTGQSSTTGEIEYVIIEDAVLQMEGQMPFEPGQSETIPVQTNGSTYWLIAEQEPGAPGLSQPIVGVEGCATNEVPIITTGILNQFPFNDADPYLDIDCPIVTSSYDPNDKTASPVGYGPEHFVEKDQGFDYTIRFQNTGNDTAFKVVIRDTLSSHLDILSVRPGLSSHPYEFDVYGDRILQFTFNNILLPDSTTNEPESNGFVRFYVDQVTDNPNGTLIENNAGIYFDFNPPIITNTVWHTIGENFIIINNTTEATNENKLLKVYPNPFVETAYLDIPEANFKQGVMQLFNLSGQLVRDEKFREFPVSLHRAGLPAGVYFLQLQLDDQAPITGRLVIGE